MATKKAESEPASGGTWEESHQRVTFHCPVELRKAIEEEVRRSGRSKSRVIVDALREHLQIEG